MNLFLVLGGTTGSSNIDGLDVQKDSITDPVYWNAANKIEANVRGNMHYAPMAIWIKNRAPDDR